MNTDPSTQDETVPLAAASTSGDNADAAPSALPEQIYDEGVLRLTVIAEEWQKTRDALLGG